MPTEAQIISGLERKVNNCFEGLARVWRFIKGITAVTTYEELIVRIELLEKLYVQFNELQDSLQNYNAPADAEKFEEEYLQIKVELRKQAASRNLVTKEVEAQVVAAVGRLAEHQKSILDTTLDKSYVNNQDLRLPRLNIPKFGGSYRDFPSFRDLFEASVHKNENLQTSHKFHYLKGLLVDEAADLIKYMQLTDANYPQAWMKLVDRYDKKRYIIAEMIQTFLQQPAISSKDGSLRRLCDKSDEVLRGLQALGKSADTRDPWLIQILMPKLNKDIQHRWALSSADNNFPTIEEFLKFLNGQCDAMETCQAETNQPKGFNYSQSQHVVKCHNVIQQIQNCLKCNADHPVYRCKEFEDLSRDDRFQLLRSKGACFNCLSRSHMKERCPSRSTCRICFRRHHTLLHSDRIDQSAISNAKMNSITCEPRQSANKPTDEVKLSTCGQLGLNHTQLDQVALLPTAQVWVENQFGERILARILLDSGSQATFIRESLANRLKLRRSKARISVSGIATSEMVTQGAVNFRLYANEPGNTVNISIHAYILKKMMTIPPKSITFTNDDLNQLSKLSLADSEYEQSQPIDILVGADYFFSIITEGRKILSEGIVVVNTLFGWVLSGIKAIGGQKMFNSFQLNCNLDNILEKFWETESIHYTEEYTDEERLAVKHFNETVTIAADGRYMVSLPFKSDATLSGDCYGVAFKRFLSIERRFVVDARLKTEYSKFIQEYNDLGHMELAVHNNESIKAGVNHYYLPHHAVFKTDNGTQKIRVVFDGSVKPTGSERSLNDLLLVGPNLQPTLWSTLIRFRKHAVSLVADIEKMYRQIWIEPSDRMFQKILWRDDTSKPLKTYQLKTVTYGTSCAPFLAIASLQHLGKSIQDTNPKVAQTILRDFYVDDLITGANTINETIALKNEITDVLKNRGFNLRKVFSSHVSLMDGDNQNITLEEQNDVYKIFGVVWKSTNDSFSFNVTLHVNEILTKRSFISQVAQIYDPFGFLAPVVIIAKILFQRLWALKIDWDQEVPDTVADSWIKIRNQIHELSELNLPRFFSVGLANITKYEIHGFSDASEDAFAAVVYSRVINSQGRVTIRLLAAKSKVAPLKQISVPRLELCGAWLLSQLIQQVLESLNLEDYGLFAWTDSTIVLAWLSDIPRRWKTYIANRTSAILQIIPISSWRHVESGDNPADYATRGLYPSDLIQNNQWWSGPAWLQDDESIWPCSPKISKESIVRANEEEKSIKLVFSLNCEEHHPVNEVLNRVSTWDKMLRVISYMYRWYNKNKFKGPICVKEMFKAELIVIKHQQQLAFGREIYALQQNCAISKKSSLITLTPFIDKDGLIRVGGRIQRSSVSYNQKHPIIIPRSSPISRILIKQLHQFHLHPGPSLLTHLTRQKYWIIGAKLIAKDVSRKCITCVKYKTTTVKQLMENLPQARVNPGRPFSKVAIDYAGPISLLSKKGRGAKIIKGYVCVFIDMVIKAVHLEAVSDMTTEAFIMALKRFVGLRGCPSYILTDNGSNFIGASRRLKEVYDLVCSREHKKEVLEYLTASRIHWEFSPPASPHFNGLVESTVKSMKYHLHRVTKDFFLTLEELSTLLHQISGILNSRPLCPNDDSLDDLDVLTPNHFLTMGSPVELLEADSSDEVIPSAKRWKQVQARVNGFWRRFHFEYLSTLQQRHKWRTAKPNFAVGDLVLLRDDNLQPGRWPRGRIIETHEGADGIVRVVTIRTAASILRRSVHKLIRLPLED